MRSFVYRISAVQDDQDVEEVYRDSDVKVVTIPDVESVNYGRGVCYEINEHVPPQNIGFISATNIREGVKIGNDSWKENVDSSIHNLVIEYLGE